MSDPSPPPPPPPFGPGAPSPMPSPSPSAVPPPPPPLTPEGWYPDPFGRHEHRWYNGTNWTSDVADGGQRFVDPLGVLPSPGGPPTSGRNGIATAALTCGIIGLFLAWIPVLVVLGVVLGVLALVFGIKGLRRSRRVGTGRGFAITGIVTGTATMLLAVVGVVLTVLVFREVIDYAEPGPVTITVTDCSIDGQRAIVVGSITNESDETRGYTVFVQLAGGREHAVLDDVAPGESREWNVEVTGRRPIAGCDPRVIVNGPFPFDVEMDPIDT